MKNENLKLHYNKNEINLNENIQFYLETNFKQTDLGPLPKDWQVVRLGEVVDTIKGRKPNVLVDNYQLGHIPYLTAEYFRTKEAKQFCKVTNENIVLVNEDDLVFIWDGSNAGEIFTGLKGVLASTMIKIKPKNHRLSNLMLYFYLKSKFDIFNNQTTGSTIPHVNKNIFQNLPILLPPLPEQQAIAEVLKTIQEAKEKTEAVIKATRELKKSMMKHLFTYGNVPLSEVDKVKLKETEIGPIPEHWKVVRLGEVINEIISGDWGEEIELEDSCLCYVIRGTDFINIEKNLYNKIPKKYIKIKSLEKRKLNENDILVELSGGGPDQPTGRIFLVNKVISEIFDKACFSNFVKKIKVDVNKVTPCYFYRYWQYLYQNGKTKIYEKRTTGIRNFKLNDFINKESIPLPPLSEQQAIADILQAIDDKIQKEEARKKALENLFKSMLNNLMSGRLRVKI